MFLFGTPASSGGGGDGSFRDIGPFGNDGPLPMSRNIHLEILIITRVFIIFEKKKHETPYRRITKGFSFTCSQQPRSSISCRNSLSDILCPVSMSYYALNVQKQTRKVRGDLNLRTDILILILKKLTMIFVNTNMQQRYATNCLWTLLLLFYQQHLLQSWRKDVGLNSF